MKIKLLALVAFLLSVVSASAQQKYLLPIGSNVNSRATKVAMVVGPVDAWEKRAEDVFSYQPSMGKFETVVQSRFQALVQKFPVSGMEKADYGMDITTDTGPYTYATFNFQKKESQSQWVAPPEVLEVKLQYGASVGWKLQGLTAVMLHLYKDGNTVKLWSTKDENSGDSPCDIGSAQSIMAMGTAVIRVPYSLPLLKENWWDTGEVTIEAYDGWATFYNANGSPRDGELIAASSPPPAFLESLRAPEDIQSQSQAPVLVASVPRIASIKRVFGEITEIVVEGTPSTSVVVEWTGQLNGEWQPLSGLVVPLALNTNGSGILTHKNTSASGFYRVRLADSSSPQ